jgi:hypothetical protein
LIDQKIFGTFDRYAFHQSLLPSDSRVQPFLCPTAVKEFIIMLAPKSNRIFNLIRNVSTAEWIVLGSIIILGIASRLFLEQQWNFKPVAAFVLFGGFFFRHWWFSAIAMLAIMWPTDQQLGLYDWRIMTATYLSLAVAAGLGAFVRRRHQLELAGWSWALSFVAASLAMSSLFFVLSNAAVWWAWYPHNWEGLRNCYTAAIPFFRPTIQSDLLFTALTVGGYAVALKALANKPANHAPVELNVIRNENVSR